MTYVETTPVDIAGMTESGRRRVALMPIGPGVEPVEGRLVVVNLELIPAEVRSWRIGVRIAGVPPGLAAVLEPGEVELVVEAPAGALASDFVPEVKVFPPVWRAGVYEVEPVPDLPPGVQVKALHPPVLELTLERR